jgi:hypothetical protein
MQDYASYVHECIPIDLLEQMNLKHDVLDSAGGPFLRFIASRWLRNKGTVEVVRFIHDHRPKDVIAQWEKVKNAGPCLYCTHILDTLSSDSRGAANVSSLTAMLML